MLSPEFRSLSRTFEYFSRGFLLSILLAAASAVAFGARDNWRYVRTSNFEIVSAASEKKTRELVVDLEQFRASFISTFGLKPAHEPRVTVVLFDSHSQFKPYYPLYNGKPKRVAGYFVPGIDEVAIALTAEQDEDEGLEPTETILHEYVHFLLNARELRLPTWLNEGIAELFSTFRVNGKVVEYGRPKDLYVEVLNASPLIPMPKLMAVTESSPEYNEEHRAGMFYAQSWAMAHFLICGEDRNNALRLSRFLELIQQPGADADAVFRDVFAKDFKELPTKLRAYLSGGRYYQRQAPVPLKDMAATVTIRAATDLERDFALLNLRWRVQRPNDAMLAALHLAETYPTSPRPRELLANIAAVDGDAGRALERWTEAAELGSDNPFVFVQAARAELLELHPGADHQARLTAATAARVRGWLERACTASPGYDDAWETLALAEARAPEFRIPMVIEVQKRIPQLKDRNPTLLALALVRWRAGDLATANHLLDTVKESSTAKPHSKAAAEVMRRQFAGNFAGESIPPSTIFGTAPQSPRDDLRLRAGEP